jgi:hypothetical protein
VGPCRTYDCSARLEVAVLLDSAGPLAQLAEHRTLNPQVPGSSPGGPTTTTRAFAPSEFRSDSRRGRNGDKPSPTALPSASAAPWGGLNLNQDPVAHGERVFGTLLATVVLENGPLPDDVGPILHEARDVVRRRAARIDPTHMSLGRQMLDGNPISPSPVQVHVEVRIRTSLTTRRSFRPVRPTPNSSRTARKGRGPSPS